MSSSAARPLIAVTSSEMRDGGAAGRREGRPRLEMALGLRYLDAIQAAGGVPVVVPPLRVDALGALLDQVDGVCFSGGPDLHPAAYGESPHPLLGPPEPWLDAFELAVALGADRRELPILAICRGVQLLNVARGGTLHQHLPEVAGEGIEHRQRVPVEQPTHDVEVAEGSRLEAILGCRRVSVNSLHHQAVRTPGRRLVATAWAPDGTIEALEDAERDFVVGVQWHAECLVDRAEHAALFEGFVATASAGCVRPLRRSAGAA